MTIRNDYNTPTTIPNLAPVGPGSQPFVIHPILRGQPFFYQRIASPPVSATFASPIYFNWNPTYYAFSHPPLGLINQIPPLLPPSELPAQRQDLLTAAATDSVARSIVESLQPNQEHTLPVSIATQPTLRPNTTAPTSKAAKKRKEGKKYYLEHRSELQARARARYALNRVRIQAERAARRAATDALSQAEPNPQAQAAETLLQLQKAKP